MFGVSHAYWLCRQVQPAVRPPAMGRQEAKTEVTDAEIVQTMARIYAGQPS